jgi:PAS domain-containing protein
MCFGDKHGTITYANDAWYKITGHPPGTGPITIQAFLSCVKDEDHDLVSSQFEKLKSSGNVQFEFRVKPLHNHSAADSHSSRQDKLSTASFDKAHLDLISPQDRMERHVLATARAEYGPDGSLVRVLTCLTDVTTQ